MENVFVTLKQLIANEIHQMPRTSEYLCANVKHIFNTGTTTYCINILDIPIKNYISVCWKQHVHNTRTVAWFILFFCSHPDTPANFIPMVNATGFLSSSLVLCSLWFRVSLDMWGCVNPLHVFIESVVSCPEAKQTCSAPSGLDCGDNYLVDNELLK